ncbi:Cytochrome c-type biogenesis protein CcmH precursor [Boseongicola aestuarii]|jgi:cytochrome c-type biogenesis protein CcmH|uniref:Cytochrome c-type biogenesis protein n=1 Tax=Boseongicola aestuarii TaxID=1470561 RepID=A0A238IUN4_9RHOB|nr:cytochrome c-type biogenesis protein [Boseongicola aestuarii]SMX22109.1 Cytochrome c-type biogenesis protein CcmH precursor [Boseongicola aestuarii]
MIRALCLAFALLVAAPALAVQPDEILDDPVLEERARDLSKNLRCLVCRNESIDESNAELARDLRLLVRERLVEGDTNDEALDFIVARYGEYVLLTPRATGSTLILWIAGPAMLLAALGIAAVYIRRRRPEVAATGLSEAEKARLSQLLDD